MYLLFNHAVSILAAIALLCGNASAAEATGIATATVILPTSISSDVSLSFGKFTSAAGAVTINPASERGASGGAPSLSPAGAGHAGQMTVSGAPGATYAITVSGGTLTGPGTPMNLTHVVVATADSTDNLITTGTLSSGGTQVLKTGGQLRVPADQSDGLYSGSYSIMVEYY